jgi:hypothetical protein
MHVTKTFVTILTLSFDTVQLWMGGRLTPRYERDLMSGCKQIINSHSISLNKFVDPMPYKTDIRHRAKPVLCRYALTEELERVKARPYHHTKSCRNSRVDLEATDPSIRTFDQLNIIATLWIQVTMNVFTITLNF